MYYNWTSPGDPCCAPSGSGKRCEEIGALLVVCVCVYDLLFFFFLLCGLLSAKDLEGSNTSKPPVV